MKKDILILIIISVIILFYNLGAGSLSSWDEAFYAEVSREMVQNNNWIDLTWGGLPWSDKPPLYIWGTAILYKIFGVNEFSTRLFSSIAGLFTIFVVYLFAKRLFSERAGFIASIMMLSTYHFLWFSRSGTLDVTFTLFILLAIYAFITAEEKTSNILYSFLWFSLAFLTKGAGALIIPIILGIYVCVRKKWRLAFNYYTVIGILLFLLTTGSWYLTASIHYGSSFFKGQLFQHMVQRTTSIMDGHTGDWMTYINVILYKGKIWGSVGLLVFPVFVFATIREKNGKNMLLVIWILTVYLLFSAVRTKLHWYIMPVYPAVIMVGAWGVEKALKNYAKSIVVICSFLGVLYFGLSKDVFTLDFNPEIKAFSAKVKEISGNYDAVYLYRIADPAMKFYLSDFGEFISPEHKENLKKGNNIVVTDREGLSYLNIKGKTLDLKSGDIIVSEAGQ